MRLTRRYLESFYRNTLHAYLESNFEQKFLSLELKKKKFYDSKKSKIIFFSPDIVIIENNYECKLFLIKLFRQIIRMR